MQPGKPLRIGAVSYLNTKPLVHRLDELMPQSRLVFDLPSRLADRLACGELDIALIPSIEYFHNPDYSIVSNACIGCRGPVLSVKLLSRVPMQDIRSVALDEGSRTSVALSRILLNQRFGLTPRQSPLAVGELAERTDTDAVLLIGDRAIHPPRDRFAYVWDLGDQWCRWSELPFVFAMWVARPGVDCSGVESALEQARDLGVRRLEEIAASQCGAVGLSFDECVEYFQKNLHFYLGRREREGLALFHRHAQRLGLAPAESRLTRNGCQTT